jgi:hypothetical protein
MHFAVLAESSSDSFQLRGVWNLLRAAVPAEEFTMRDAGAACIAFGHLVYFTMWKRRNVFPTMISSPSQSAWRCPGGNRLPRLMNVPFVDPRSSRKY